MTLSGHLSWLGPVRTSVKKQDQIHFAISRKVLVILWTRLKDFVDRVAGDERPLRNLRDEELRLAAAALLVRASVIDGEADAVERRTPQLTTPRLFLQVRRNRCSYVRDPKSGKRVARPNTAAAPLSSLNKPSHDLRGSKRRGPDGGTGPLRGSFWGEQ